jgi:hypothetical protein
MKRAVCEASRTPPLPASRPRGLHREAKVTRIQDRRQTIERWVAGLREHAIEAFPIQVRFAGQGPDAAVGLGDIAKSQEEHRASASSRQAVRYSAASFGFLSDSSKLSR